MKYFGNILKYFKNRLSDDKPGQRVNTIYVPSRQAGMVVTHDTALTYSALWACVRIISQSIAHLPWHVHQRSINSDGRVVSKRVLDHPADTILDLVPNDEMDALSMRETMLAWALTWGNAYAEIEVDRSNRPYSMYVIEPERVKPDRDSKGRLVYDIKNRGGNTVVNPSKIFHLKGLGFDGLVGYSVISQMAKAIGLGLASEQFGASFFANGTKMGTVVEHPGQLSDTALEHLKSSINESLQGPYNTGKPFVVEEGMKVSNITIPPDDAQFLQTRKFQVAEIARWYGVPLHKLAEMDKSTFNNIEHQSIEFVVDALLPWVRRLEIEANLKMISRSRRRRVYTKLNLNSLLRGDLKTRGEWYKTMSNLGVFSVNDILELEDRNPIGPDGDKRLVQLNLTTLEKVGEDAVNSQSVGVPATENEETSQESRTGTAAQRDVVRQGVERSLSREHHRAVDALRRYDGDRSGLINWMNQFYAQHASYIRDQLDAPLKALGVYDPGSMIDQFLDAHIDSSRIEILDAFDAGRINDPIIRQAPELTEQLLRTSL